MKKVLGRLLKIALVLAGLYVLAVVLTVFLTLYRPKYTPEAVLAHLRDACGNEIVALHDAMTAHFAETGAPDIYDEFFISQPERWEPEAYAAAQRLMAQAAETTGRSYGDVSFYRFAGRQSMIVLEASQHYESLVFLCYAPDGHPWPESILPLNDQPGWYYWVYGY